MLGKAWSVSHSSAYRYMYTTTYKGYTGKFEIDFDDNLISGIVIDIKDVITFHSKTIEEALQCFHESVDDYLEFCQELGEEPNICSKTLQTRG